MHHSPTTSLSFCQAFSLGNAKEKSGWSESITTDDGTKYACQNFGPKELPTKSATDPYLYDTFGNTLSKSGLLADANTYRFSSKEWIASAGLAYYLYRYYDPNLQRWLSRDPIEENGGINLFGFSCNDPLAGC
jgi:RHS repeat-associated protein